MLPARHKTGGFTLIEVLVAFMILTLTLSVLFRIFSTGLRNVAISAEYARAMLIAESQLAEAGISSPLELGVTAGESGERFRWRRVVERYLPYEEEEQLPELPVQAFEVTIEVDWERNGRVQQVSLSSIRLQQNGNFGGRG